MSFVGKRIVVKSGFLKGSHGLVQADCGGGVFYVVCLPGDIGEQYLLAGTFELDEPKPDPAIAFYREHFTAELEPPPSMLRLIRVWLAVRDWWRQ